MKRIYKIVFLLLASSLVLSSIILFYKNNQIRQKSSNIFDEMYYDELSLPTRVFNLGQTHLERFPNVEHQKRGKGDEGAIPIEAPNSSYWYDKKSLGNKSHYRNIEFYYPPKTLYENGIVNFSMEYAHDKQVRVGFDYIYNVKTKTLAKSYYIYISNEDKLLYKGTNSSEIKDILTKKGLTEKDIYKYGDQQLATILKDWTTIYSSRFSYKEGEWGKVSIKTVVQYSTNDNFEKLTKTS